MKSAIVTTDAAVPSDRDEFGKRASTGDVEREVDPTAVKCADPLGQPWP